jgi:hypothetical protein
MIVFLHAVAVSDAADGATGGHRRAVLVTASAKGSDSAG